MTEQYVPQHADLTPAAPEAVVGAVIDPRPGKPGVEVAVDPTQVRRPWRSTIRTAFQMTVALATLLPFIAAGIYKTDADYPAVVAQVLVVASAITRVMALPQVERFLRDYLPFLSAAPRG